MMNNTEIRIAVAELCGYKKVKCPTSCLEGFDPQKPKPMIYWAEESWDGIVIGLPDYPNDLNAMHEAEKMLEGKQRIEYVNQLFISNDTDKVGWDNASIRLVFFPFICATASQRAEAFLRTFGKWKE